MTQVPFLIYYKDMKKVIIRIQFFGDKMYYRGQTAFLPVHYAQHLEQRGLVAIVHHRAEHDRQLVVLCIASGASLTKKDCDLVEEWRFAEQDKEDRRVYAINNSYERAPFADVLFAVDKLWWEVYKPNFKGKKVSVHRDLAGVEDACIAANVINENPNSGGLAMVYAMQQGATRIILLGYDLKVGKFGRKHWHKDHVAPLGNAGKISEWCAQFKLHYKHFKNVDVINCTRDTALDIYPKVKLEEELSC